MRRDIHLLAEAYKIVREQGPMSAAVQGAYQGVMPYAAGAVAGTKQLGQNLAGAITGSQQAPQNPVGAGQQAFSQQQQQQAILNVMKAFNIPSNFYGVIQNQIVKAASDAQSQVQGINNQKVQGMLNQTGKQLTGTSIPPQIGSKGQVYPGYTSSNYGQLPLSQTMQGALPRIDSRGSVQPLALN